MRLLLLLAAVLMLFALAGWLTFSKEAGRSSINLETDEIRQDTGEAMRKGSEILQEAEEKVAPKEVPQSTGASTSAL
jgi:hypothetical protein